MSTSSSHTSEVEKQRFNGVDNEVNTRRHGNRRRKIIIASVVGLVVIVVLAVGLGVGLTRNKMGNQEVGPRNSLPSAGTNDDQAGLRESGSYFTSYADESIQFLWTPTNFALTSGGVTSSSNPVIYINGSDVGQTMDGFGAALTDSSAQLFSNLKAANVTVYNSVLDNIFNQRNGINILRVPIGSSDFSPESLQYTMADQMGTQANVNDTIGPLSNFNMNGADRYIIPFLKDALLRNADLKISLLPWSPPAWMKTPNSINGGTLAAGNANVLTEYLVKSVQAFRQALGVVPWSLSVQNEPTNPTAYPSMSLSNDFELSVLASLRGRLAEVGLGSVQLWGHEDNYEGFSDAAALVNFNQSSLDGIAWHCYEGSSSLLNNYTSALSANDSAKSMHMSECSGQSDNGQPSASGLQWWMNNIFSQPAQGISSITVWNLALNEDYGPRLDRAYCENCVGSIEIDSKGVVTSNLQMLLLAHHATAAANLTRFGGEPASKLATGLSGDSNNCIVSTLAFSAKWDSSNSQRVGLVVQNICTNTVTTTINVNNVQHYDIDVGNCVTSIVLTL